MRGRVEMEDELNENLTQMRRTLNNTQKLLSSDAIAISAKMKVLFRVSKTLRDTSQQVRSFSEMARQEARRVRDCQGAPVREI